MPKSTIVVDPNPDLGPGSSVPTQALISPDGNVVFDADFFGFMIHSFTIRPNGRAVDPLEWLYANTN